MAKPIIYSLFGSSGETKTPWQSYVTSVLVHAGIIGLLLVVTFPAIREVERIRESHATLIAPILKPVPPPKLKVIKIARIEPPVMPPRVVIPKILPPPVIKPPQIKPQIIAAAPVIKDVVPEVHPTTPVELPKLAPAPKPDIKTGVFAQADLAKGPHTPNQVKVGGFGDPNGVPAQNTQSTGLTMAKVGSFDLPNGGGNGGASGRGQNGGLKQTSVGAFGSGSASTGSTSGAQGPVRTGGFGDAATVSPGTTERAAVAKPLTTPVEILFKPKPLYTEEARRLKLEGQVSLDVIFLASGAVQVVRVIHGLGHGLDEAAQAAASQVKFRPATRSGVPVNTAATINITFELT